ncbi:MAM and LDL-receptor class A domain-containing protein 1 isoform X2 [Esox lucius]|uniref:MAM and LDL-receptor class A domain-containing protein 1 isoform X2 n=1 Tax=Esox lucius TaxID=8010 RepID=UPI0014772DC0|nr:MAM and LDL-receptor class A domain-containing protein 1 isoform X2 [Esox lucius]
MWSRHISVQRTSCWMISALTGAGRGTYRQVPKTFEKDTCAWYPDQTTSHLWKRSPGKDHTSGSGYFMSNNPTRNPDPSSTARLISYPQPAGTMCVSFWYRIYGSNIGSLRFLTKSSGEPETVVWMRHGTQGNEWRFADLTFTTDAPLQVIFEAVGGRDGDIAIDDLVVFNSPFPPEGFCDFEMEYHGWPNRSTIKSRRRKLEWDSSSPGGPFSSTGNHITTPSPSPAATPPACPMDCNFEQGLCNWVQKTDEAFDWVRSQGLQVNRPWNGPRYDHTVGNDQGYYMVVNMSGSVDGETAVLSVPVKVKAREFCVGFWYYMLGPSVSSLDLIRQKGSRHAMWTRQGSQDSGWMNAQVTLRKEDTWEVQFSASRKTSGSGFIAIDDVTFKEGACKDLNPCGFENTWCEFTVASGGYGFWARMANVMDHTFRTEKGFYLTVLIMDPKQTSVAQLFSPELSASTGMCVRFWYRLPVGSTESLSAHVLWSGEQGPALWQRSGAPSTGWEVAELTVSAPNSFKVVFRAEHAPGSVSTVQIDDVSIRAGPCSPVGSCDFESGQCTWVNEAQPDGHDWVQADGRFQGPATDHTTQTAEGRFLLSPAQSQNQSNRAVVVSEWIQFKIKSTCLNVWYYIHGRNSGTLRLFARSGPTEQELLFQTQSGQSNWTLFSGAVQKSEPFQVLVEAESSDSGFIAVDDIIMTPGLCPDSSTDRGFLGCSFENGTCEWEDISVGQFTWQRDRNGTATKNTGPSVDHTLGTELGWYMLVESSRGDVNDFAKLQSPFMKQASAECLLEFYYHMNGKGIGELRVLLQEGSRTTPLWWRSGDQGDAWRRGEVKVGRTPQVFSLFFQATRTSSQLGDIAIDDILFLNCIGPGEQQIQTDDPIHVWLAVVLSLLLVAVIVIVSFLFQQKCSIPVTEEAPRSWTPVPVELSETQV